ncbi:MAG: phosphate ABC transporter permease PstA [Chloroflexi bacterium]|nr:phosphate ABC transporter permease PstA [Chloroflexota bacterium]
MSTAPRWSDVRANWPDKPLLRFIPAPESAAFEVFIDAAFGLEPASHHERVLSALLVDNLPVGVVRRLNREKPLDQRSHDELYQLVVERIIEPTIVQTWSLLESIFEKETIEAAVAQTPRARLEFRSWVNKDFLTSPQSSQPELAGIRTAILGSLWVVLITLLFSVPVGVGAAIYLEEYGSGRWLDQLIETNINNLAGVPSIIYGMLGLAVFVRALEPLTSGQVFGLVDPTTANGRTILSAGLTLGLLILPIIIINAREAIRAVPRAFREASYGLGATKWQTIWYHVLPNAIPGILTGSILAISRAFGETAPLVVVGASTAIFMDPSGPFSKFTTLPIQIYQWTARPQEAFHNLAAATIIVLLTLLLLLNAAAVILRNRHQRSY